MAPDSSAVGVTISSKGRSDRCQEELERLAKYAELAPGSDMYADAFKACKVSARRFWRVRKELD